MCFKVKPTTTSRTQTLSMAGRTAPLLVVTNSPASERKTGQKMFQNVAKRDFQFAPIDQRVVGARQPPAGTRTVMGALGEHYGAVWRGSTRDQATLDPFVGGFSATFCTPHWQPLAATGTQHTFVGWSARIQPGCLRPTSGTLAHLLGTVGVGSEALPNSALGENVGPPTNCVNNRTV